MSRHYQRKAEKFNSFFLKEGLESQEVPCNNCCLDTLTNAGYCSERWCADPTPEYEFDPGIEYLTQVIAPYDELSFEWAEEQSLHRVMQSDTDTIKGSSLSSVLKALGKL